MFSARFEMAVLCGESNAGCIVLINNGWWQLASTIRGGSGERAVVEQFKKNAADRDELSSSHTEGNVLRLGGA